jgi:hypothetical protein
VDRATGRALAAAISSLAVATIVVSQSSEGLQIEGTVAANDFESGTIALVDDDSGRSLVHLEEMAPGRPVEQCIAVSYAGSVLPVDLSLGAETSGDIARFVEVRVERGVGGGFGDCEAFRPDQELFIGDLASLEDRSVELGQFHNQDETATFRFRFDLLDDADAAGRGGSVDFVWQAVPA